MGKREMTVARRVETFSRPIGRDWAMKPGGRRLVDWTPMSLTYLESEEQQGEQMSLTLNLLLGLLRSVETVQASPQEAVWRERANRALDRHLQALSASREPDAQAIRLLAERVFSLVNTEREREIRAQGIPARGAAPQGRAEALPAAREAQREALFREISHLRERVERQREQAILIREASAPPAMRMAGGIRARANAPVAAGLPGRFGAFRRAGERERTQAQGPQRANEGVPAIPRDDETSPAAQAWQAREEDVAVPERTSHNPPALTGWLSPVYLSHIAYRNAVSETGAMGLPSGQTASAIVREMRLRLQPGAQSVLLLRQREREEERIRETLLSRVLERLAREGALEMRSPDAQGAARGAESAALAGREGRETLLPGGRERIAYRPADRDAASWEAIFARAGEAYPATPYGRPARAILPAGHAGGFELPLLRTGVLDDAPMTGASRALQAGGAVPAALRHLAPRASQDEAAILTQARSAVQRAGAGDRLAEQALAEAVRSALRTELADAARTGEGGGQREGFVVYRDAGGALRRAPMTAPRGQDFAPPRATEEYDEESLAPEAAEAARPGVEAADQRRRNVARRQALHLAGWPDGAVFSLWMAGRMKMPTAIARSGRRMPSVGPLSRGEADGYIPVALRWPQGTTGGGGAGSAGEARRSGGARSIQGGEPRAEEILLRTVRDALIAAAVRQGMQRERRGAELSAPAVRSAAREVPSSARDGQERATLRQVREALLRELATQAASPAHAARLRAQERRSDSLSAAAAPYGEPETGGAARPLRMRRTIAQAQADAAPWGWPALQAAPETEITLLAARMRRMGLPLAASSQEQADITASVTQGRSAAALIHLISRAGEPGARAGGPTAGGAGARGAAWEAGVAMRAAAAALRSALSGAGDGPAARSFSAPYGASGATRPAGAAFPALPEAEAPEGTEPSAGSLSAALRAAVRRAGAAPALRHLTAALEGMSAQNAPVTASPIVPLISRRALARPLSASAAGEEARDGAGSPAPYVAGEAAARAFPQGIVRAEDIAGTLRHPEGRAFRPRMAIARPGEAQGVAADYAAPTHLRLRREREEAPGALAAQPSPVRPIALSHRKGQERSREEAAAQIRTQTSAQMEDIRRLTAQPRPQQEPPRQAASRDAPMRIDQAQMDRIVGHVVDRVQSEMKRERLRRGMM